MLLLENQLLCFSASFTALLSSTLIESFLFDKKDSINLPILDK